MPIFINKYSWKWWKLLFKFWNSKQAGDTPKHFEFDFWIELQKENGNFYVIRS